MIGYSDHGVGYLDPDQHDPQILYMITEEKEEEEKKEEYKEDRLEDVGVFLHVAFDKLLSWEELNEIFSDKWW